MLVDVEIDVNNQNYELSTLVDFRSIKFVLCTVRWSFYTFTINRVESYGTVIKNLFGYNFLKFYRLLSLSTRIRGITLEAREHSMDVV